MKRFALCYRTIVCLSCLSVTLVYCGQTVGWIKMKLGMQVGLGPGHTVLDVDPAPPPPKRGHSPQLSAHVYCGQMAAWIKMSLGMELGLDPSEFVLDRDPGPVPQKRAEPPSKKFGPCLLGPNGWMDQDGTWHGSRPQPRWLCVRWGPSPTSKFSAHVYYSSWKHCTLVIHRVKWRHISVVAIRSPFCRSTSSYCA